MAIIQKCTSYIPDERYETVQVFRSALEASQKHLKPMPDGFQYPSGKGSDPHTEPQTHPDILSLFSILSDHDGQPNDDNITLKLMDGHTAVLPVDLRSTPFTKH